MLSAASDDDRGKQRFFMYDGRHPASRRVQPIVGIDQAITMFQEHSQVLLACPLPALGLQPGAVGVVVHVRGERAACEVEFMSLDGRTIGLETLRADQSRAVAASAVPHERLRAGA